MSKKKFAIKCGCAFLVGLGLGCISNIFYNMMSGVSERDIALLKTVESPYNYTVLECDGASRASLYDISGEEIGKICDFSDVGATLGYYGTDKEYKIEFNRDDRKNNRDCLTFNFKVATNKEDSTKTERIISFMGANSTVKLGVTDGEINCYADVVTGLGSCNQDGKVKVFWDSLDGASGYRVYKRYVIDGEYKYVGDTNENVYLTDSDWLDNSDKETVRYYVAPVFEDGEGGFDSCAYCFGSSAV